MDLEKAFNAQRYLINSLEKWGQSPDQDLVFGELLTELSKSFHCLSHELLVAKLVAYGVKILSVRLIYDYLTDRKQRTNIGKITVPGKTSQLEYHKDQFYAHYFIFIYVTCFSYLKIYT